MNTALDTVVPIRPDLRAVEQRVADLDDGFTRVANELLDAVLASGLTEIQLHIVLAVWRKTYGWNKKMDWISNEEFERMTTKDRTKCSTAKNQLIRMQVLIQRGRHVGMNKNISDWETKVNGFGKTFTESVKKSFTESAKGSLPNQSNTKDIIQKTLNTTNTSADADDAPHPAEKEQAMSEQNPEPQEQKKPALSCEAVLAVYHEVLPEAKGVRLLSDKRRNQIRTFWKKASKITRELDGKPFTLDSWREYLSYIAENCRWMLEERPDNRSGRVWQRKGLEYFLNDENYLLVREGAKDDR